MSTATIEKTEAIVGYRKNKQGVWVLYGPADLVVEGPVTATRKNGTTTVAIVLGVGKDFLVDGVPYRYGYLTPKADEQEPKPAAQTPAAASDLDFVPDDFMPGNDVEDPADWG